jgi:N utilization substance protein B
MNRRTARELALGLVFQIDFNRDCAGELIDCFLTPDSFNRLKEEDALFMELPQDEERGYIERIARGVAEHMTDIDAYIEKYATGWRIDRIPRMAKAIIRLSIFELLFMDDIPEGVSVNEAVELTKKYEDEDMPGFINGLLGAFIRTERSGE